jgi:hypothetical protein
MKLYGDLLKVIKFKNKTKLKIIKSNKLIRHCMRFYLLQCTFNFYVGYGFFRKLNPRISKCINKIKNVTNTNKLINHKQITHVIFKANFNKPNHYLSHNLKSLKFIHHFNQKIYLPSNLIFLELSHEFNQSIDYLPSTLLYLKFGDHFNKKLCELPLKLLFLKFGSAFNQLINYFPKSLIFIEFGYCYNQLLYNLPSSLITLSLHVNFNINNLIDLDKKVKLKIHNN